MKRLAVGVAVLAAALAATTGTAAAKSPCWRVLINDWYDGRIDNVYPIHCYRDALKHIPEDSRNYSSLADDINRAMAAAIAGRPFGGGPKAGSGGPTFYGGPTAGGGVPTGSTGRDTGEGGPVARAINSIGPDSADSVPIPLIVLGSLAVFLVALGSAVFLARRVQARRAAVRPTPKN